MPACDSHLHIFDLDRFPVSDAAPYVPPPAERGAVEDLVALHDAHGITHALLIQPSSGYGLDNACMLHAIEAGGGRFRGLAQIVPEAGEEEIARLAEQGCIGVRLDLAGKGMVQLERWRDAGLFARLRNAGWIVGVLGRGAQWAEAAPALLRAEVPLMVDHCGLPDIAAGTDAPGFQAVLGLLREGAAVKLSGADRWGFGAWPYAEADPFVAACLKAAAPENLLWGSDWPFVRAPRRVDYGPVRTLLDRWVSDAALRRRILWDNPARWFGFTA